MAQALERNLWAMEEVRQSASVLYNHLCSDDANKVYVDAEGHLKVDDRGWLMRWLRPLGDSTRETTNRAAIDTLRRVLNAKEDGTLEDINRLIVQNRTPIGLFMDEHDDELLHAGVIGGLINPGDIPDIEERIRPAPNMKWLSTEKFAKNIGNASRFKTWMPCRLARVEELTYEQRICRKVTRLTQMIMNGREHFIASSEGDALSDDER